MSSAPPRRTPLAIAATQRGVRGRERTIAGSAATRINPTPTKAVGSTTFRLSSASARSASPAATSAALETAAPRKNKPADRRTIHRPGAPVSAASQPPIASPPAPPPGRSAPDPCAVHARIRASRASRASKNSRNTTTKLTAEASSSATATRIHPGPMSPISRSTPRRLGTAASSAIPSATSSAIVASRLPIRGSPRRRAGRLAAAATLRPSAGGRWPSGRARGEWSSGRGERGHGVTRSGPAARRLGDWSRPSVP